MTDKNTCFQVKNTWNIAGRIIDLSSPTVMGILNLTPDSFFDGGKYHAEKEALSQVEKMLGEGASIVDIGAYSSRPGAEAIGEQEEMARLIPVLAAIKKEFPAALISIDTFRSKVAGAAVSEGAHIINDISGGELDAEMFKTVAALGVPYILMHMRGTPQTMTALNHYEDVFSELLMYFTGKIEQLKLLGVHDIVIDPGFGFAKTPARSFELLRRLADFRICGFPVLAGVSRKSMIYKTLGVTAADALNGTTVLNTIALLNGASILRVHDVRPAIEAIVLTRQLNANL